MERNTILKRVVKVVLGGMTGLYIMMQNVAVMATAPTNQDVYTAIDSRKAVLNVITIGLVFVAAIMIGWEFIIHRKDKDKRAETQESIPWVIIGVIFFILALQITKALVL